MNIKKLYTQIKKEEMTQPLTLTNFNALKDLKTKLFELTKVLSNYNDFLGIKASLAQILKIFLIFKIFLIKASFIIKFLK